MKRVLVPVDGSESAMRAVRHVVSSFLGDSAMEVHLLHVRVPFSQHISRLVSQRDRERFHRDMAEKALRPARELLARHGVPHATHVELGETAATIDRIAQRLRVSQIVIGTARRNTLTRLVQDSVTSKLLEIARAPVEVVSGGAASRWERIGIPAGVGTALLAVALTID